MAKLGEEELKILQRALDKYPDGLDSPSDYQSAEYAAFVRLYEAGLIDTSVDPLFFGGRRSYPHYRECKITESGRGALDQVAEELGNIDSGDELMLMGLSEGRRIIIEHVRNLHGASNELHIRITVKEVEEVTEQVGKSGPKVVKKLLTDWLPSSLTSSAIRMLFDILRMSG